MNLRGHDRGTCSLTLISRHLSPTSSLSFSFHPKRIDKKLLSTLALLKFIAAQNFRCHPRTTGLCYTSLGTVGRGRQPTGNWERLPFLSLSISLAHILPTVSLTPFTSQREQSKTAQGFKQGIWREKIRCLLPPFFSLLSLSYILSHHT